MLQYVKLKLIKYIRLHLKNVDDQLKTNSLNTVFIKIGEVWMKYSHGQSSFIRRTHCTKMFLLLWFSGYYS